MLIETAHIDKITASRYDELLAAGWFRSRDIIYRSDLICMDKQVSSVRHIRYDLDEFTLKKRHRKLLAKNDSRFTISVSPVFITSDTERLYASHSKRFKGFVHSSMAESVFPFSTQDGNGTLQLNVFDGNRLVASSFFDTGKKAAASIHCVYDAEYSQHSLGIYTMLKEMAYLKEHDIRYYYPGYVLDRPSCFDYKLSLGKCQWLSQDAQWYAAIQEKDYKTKSMLLEEKMAELRLRLALEGYEARMVYYPYFTVAYLNAADDSLVKYSCYFLVDDSSGEFAASYDLELEDFVVFCPFQSPDYNLQRMEFSEDYKNSSVYEMRVMQSAFLYLLSDMLEMRSNELKFQP